MLKFRWGWGWEADGFSLPSSSYPDGISKSTGSSIRNTRIWKMHTKLLMGSVKVALDHVTEPGGGHTVKFIVAPGNQFSRDSFIGDISVFQEVLAASSF